MNDLNPSTAVRSLPTNLPSIYDFQQPQQSSTSEVQLREYIRIIFKYRMLIAATVGVCLVLAMLHAFTATPLYTAETKVRISTYEPVLSATHIEDVLQEKSKETNYLETQLQEMKSYSLADKVLQDGAVHDAFNKPQKSGFFSSLFGGASSNSDEVLTSVDQAAGYKVPIAVIKRYLKTIEIKPVRRTSLVNIEATSDSAQLSALISNKHALSYIDWVRESRIEQQARGLTFLRVQSDELREKVVDLERELADYAEANSIVAVNKDENITAQKMSQINKLLSDSTAKRIEAENTFKEAEASLEKPAAGFDDASTQVMNTELAKLEAEYQQLGAKFTSSYPKMVQMRSEIDGLKKAIDARRQEIVRGLKSKMQAAQQEEKNLSEELDQQKSQAFELSKRQVQYNVLNRELTSSRELLQSVLKQIKETSLAVESNASNVSIVDYAVTPQSPSYPRKKIIMLLGICLGLGLGLGLAFILNYLDNTIRTPEDVQQVLKLPNLGVVPSFELEQLPTPGSSNPDLTSGVNGNGPGPSPNGDAHVEPASVASSELIVTGGYIPAHIAYLSSPRSLAAEAYRTIRTGILLSQAGEPPKTILVSSAQSSEGKTTSSINLAACLASSGGKVILIDADLRRPSLHRHFQMVTNEPGLVDVITGQRTLDEVIIKDVVKRLCMIPSGKIPPNPAELLGSLEMATVIDQLAQIYDYVIIDSPPILPVTDSVILSRYVDGVVLVVRGASTPRRVVNDAKDRLKSVGARMLGTILNDVDVRGGDYYYYNRYYHAYYQEEQNAEASRPRRSAVG